MAKAKQSVESEPAPIDPGAMYQRIANVLALLLVKDLKNQGDQIALLNRAGFKTGEIAAMLGAANNTVSVTLYQQKKPKKKKKK